MLKKVITLFLMFCMLCFGASCSKKKPTSRKERERQRTIDAYTQKAKEAAREAAVAAGDAKITAQIRATYLLDDDLRGADIDVRTERKAVYLTGTVASEKIRKKAESLAREVEGIAGVRNKITVAEASQTE